MANLKYTLGGPIGPDGLYVERAADEEIIQLCQKSTLIYVLAPKDMGKSSFMRHAADRLRRLQFHVVTCDLGSIGSPLQSERWFLEILTHVKRDLRLSIDERAFWTKHAALSPPDRLMRFLDEQVVRRISNRLIVFLDGVEATRSLDLREAFFAAIRAAHRGKRKTDAGSMEAFGERLSFVLLGDAEPGDLIGENGQSPFVVGHELVLSDFTWKQAATLIEDWDIDPVKATEVILWIQFATGGHPYLTQTLCKELSGAGPAHWSSESIALCAERLFQYGHSQADAHLASMEDALLGAPKNAKLDLALLLEAYRVIWRGRRVREDPKSRVHGYLKACGIVKQSEGGELSVRNRIYHRIFDARWVRQHMPAPYVQKQLRRTNQALLAAGVLLSISAGVAVTAWHERRHAEERANQRTGTIQQLQQSLQEERQRTTAPGVVASKFAALSLLGSLSPNQTGIPLDVSLLLGVEALRLGETPAAASGLFFTLNAHPNLLTMLHGHRQGVQSVVYSPDGQMLASASWDSIRLWKTTPPGSAPVSISPGSGTSALAWSPDGKTLAAGGADHKVRLYEATAGRLLGDPLQGHSDTVSAVAWSPDGKTLASASWDKTIRLWDVATGHTLGDPLTHKDRALGVAWSPDGKTLFSITFYGIWVWDFATRRHEDPPPNDQFGALALEISHDGKMLATVRNGGVQLWDATARKALGPPLQVHSEKATSVAFSVDDKTLASGSDLGVIRLWTTPRGAPAGVPLMGNSDRVEALAFQPDGKVLASGGRDATVRLWDVSGEPPSGIWKHPGFVETVAFSPDGRWLASGSNGGTVMLWDATTGKPRDTTLANHDGEVTSIAFSPDGNTIATGCTDAGVRLWDAATGQRRGEVLRGHQGKVTSVAFSPDSNIIASASEDHTFKLWSVSTGQPRPVPADPHGSRIMGIAWSPDGKTIASAGWDLKIKRWDTETGNLRGEPLAGAQSIQCLAWSPDGTTIASGTAEGTITLWDADAGKARSVVLARHSSGVTGVAFSPDGRMIASSSHDKTVRLWDIATGTLIAVFTGHTNAVESVAFQPDGRRLASGSADGTVRLWDVHLGSWRDRACRIANRNLTTREWDAYLPGRPYEKVCEELPRPEW